VLVGSCGRRWRKARAALHLRAICFYLLHLVHSGEYLGKRVRESWRGVADLLEGEGASAQNG
jgi:hypothetical protein